MSAVVLYSDAVRDLGLKYALASQPAFSNDMAIVATSQRLSPAEYSRFRRVSDELLTAYSNDIVTNTSRFGRTATFFAAPAGELPPTAENRPRANLQYAEELPDHIDVVEGRLPVVATPTGDKPPVVEGTISRTEAAKFNLKVGQELDLFAHWRATEPVRVVIVGLVEPKDLSEPYWFGRIDRFAANTPNWPTYYFWVDEKSIFEAVAPYLPDMDGQLETYAFVDATTITSSNSARIENNVRVLEEQVRAQLPITSLQTDLHDTIATYKEKLFFTRLPLFALMIQIVGIVLFYLVMVSTMVVERQQGEIALLKSRGAGTPQLMTVFVIEGMFILILATLIGPLIAVGAIKLLGLTPPFEDLSDGELLSVPLTPLAFSLALGGAVMALAALLWPAWRACRHSITNYKQQISRPNAQPIFFRYYLDLAVVGVAALGFYQLRQKGSFVTEGLFGDLSVDPILLATPSLFMLMVALVFLRLFPILLRIILRLTSGLKGATMSIGLTRMARSPLQHSRLILLLILATAVGMFAAGFRSTLERGYEDRASYRAASSLRLTDIREPIALPPEKLAASVTSTTARADVMPVLGLTGYYSPSRFRSDGVRLVGLDPERADDLMFWRDDFANDSLPTLLKTIERTPPEATLPAPVKIPGDARLIGFWAINPLPANNAAIGIRLRDKDGSIWEFRVITEGPPIPDTWQFFVGDLTRPTNTKPNGAQPNAADREWVFEGLWVLLPGTPPAIPQNISLLIDDLQTSPQAPPLGAGWGRTGLANATVIERFESIESYELMRGISTVGDPGSLARAVPPGREGNVARLSFIRGRSGSSLVAFRVIRDSRPVDVIAANAVFETYDKKIGDELQVYANGQYFQVRLVGRFKLFPGYDPETDIPLLVADYGALRDGITRYPGAGTNVYPNEAWLGPGSSSFTKEALKDKGLLVEQVLDQRVILEEQSSDPLVAASWEGILFISFASVLLISALGFITYSGLGAQARALEFAVLRTMGLSPRQVLGVVSFEQLFIVVAGVAAGTLLGFPLSRLMISYMGLTERGREPLPPLVSVVNWQSVFTVWGLLGLVVVSTVVALVALYSRLAVSRALRMGEL
ncbi:MAG: ABC transporter permease [Dehalococcoidia bacterium]